jgi:hypothetical protein
MRSMRLLRQLVQKEVPVSPQHGQPSSRRRFLGGFALAGAAGLLDVGPGSAAEPSPETTTLRVARTSSICQAPQYIAEVLLEAEGFTKVEDGSFCRWARTRHNGSRWSTKGRMGRPVFGN